MHVEGNTVQRTKGSWRALPEENDPASAEMREVAARRTRQTANAKRESHRFLDLLPIVLLHLIDRDDANGPGRLAQLVRAQR